MRYLLNVKTRKVHSWEHRKRSCRLEKVDEENLFTFDTLQEALSYLPPRREPVSLCRFCMQQVLPEEN